MKENGLINAICDDFLAQSGNDRVVFEAFCYFAAKWLREKGVVGVGQTVEGFAVRLADGSEYVLTQTPTIDAIPSDSVAISGAAGRSDRTAVNNGQVQITGR